MYYYQNKIQNLTNLPFPKVIRSDSGPTWPNGVTLVADCSFFCAAAFAAF